jgi:hypothetical protein
VVEGRLFAGMTEVRAPLVTPAEAGVHSYDILTQAHPET